MTDATGPAKVEPALMAGSVQAGTPKRTAKQKRRIQPDRSYRASPEALQKLQVGDLTPEQQRQFRELTNEFADIFAENQDALGHTDVVTHEINLTDNTPIKQRFYRHSRMANDFIRTETQRMQALGIAVPSDSPWASPVVVVTKKGGSLRFCVDYRKLNNVTVKDAYPLPRIDDLLDSFDGAKYFSSLDLQSGYWQVAMDPKDQAKTAFITRDGLFEFTVMPFGLTNAPSTFQRLMNIILNDLRWKCVAVYLDDINVYSPSWEQHLKDLRATFTRLRAANLRLNIGKCEFAKPRLVFLGYVVTAAGIHTDPEKVAKMQAARPPKDRTELRGFLGMMSFYRRFIQNFSALAQPLNRLLRKGQPFKWSSHQQEAFETLKRRMTEAPILSYPDPNARYQLYTDASHQGLGAVLGQNDSQGRSRVIAYASTSLNTGEQRYAPVHLECRGVVWAIRQFRHYLHGQDFDVYTDQEALKSLLKQGPDAFANRTMGRWIHELQQHRFTVHYRPGPKNRADYLSRAL